MTEEKNNDVKTAQEAANKAMQGLVNYMTTPLMVVVRGLASMAPKIRPELLLLAACHAFASVIGQVYGGSEEEVKSLRDACRVAFAGTLHQAPIQGVKREDEPVKEVEAA